jgi:hypothetical protein
MHRTLHLRVFYLLLACTVGCFGLCATGGISVARPSALLVEARSLAAALMLAPSDQAAEMAIERILVRLGVPILYGEEHPSAALGLGIFPVEITMAAQSFRNGTLLPLDDLADTWSQAGLECAGEPCTGAMVEAALRELRQRAEQDPDNEDWLLILLVDALGDRENAPFDLRGSPDVTYLASLSGSGTMSSVDVPSQFSEGQDMGIPSSMSSFPTLLMAEALEEAMQEEDDEDIRRMLGALQNPDNMASMLEALSKGDPMSGMATLLQEMDHDPEAIQRQIQEAERAAEQGDMAGVLEKAESSLPPEFRNQDSTDSWLRRRDETKEHWEYAKAHAEQIYASTTAELDEYDLQGCFAAGFRYLAETYMADHYLEPLYLEANYIAEREERAQEEADDYSHLSGLPAPAREPTSSLQLDPVQVMLVALDLVELRGPSGGGKQP